MTQKLTFLLIGLLGIIVSQWEVTDSTRPKRMVYSNIFSAISDMSKRSSLISSDSKSSIRTITDRSEFQERTFDSIIRAVSTTFAPVHHYLSGKVKPVLQQFPSISTEYGSVIANSLPVKTSMKTNYLSSSNGGRTMEMKSIPGTAGIDYPIYSSIPQTTFSCSQQTFPGFYADVDTDCQVFYICQGNGQSDGFLCPNGTVFHQEYFICDWWYNVNCPSSSRFFGLNEFIFQN